MDDANFVLEGEADDGFHIQDDPDDDSTTEDELETFIESHLTAFHEAQQQKYAELQASGHYISEPLASPAPMQQQIRAEVKQQSLHSDASWTGLERSVYVPPVASGSPACAAIKFRPQSAVPAASIAQSGTLGHIGTADSAVLDYVDLVSPVESSESLQDTQPGSEGLMAADSAVADAVTRQDEQFANSSLSGTAIDQQGIRASAGAQMGAEASVNQVLDATSPAMRTVITAIADKRNALQENAAQMQTTEQQGSKASREASRDLAAADISNDGNTPGVFIDSINATEAGNATAVDGAARAVQLDHHGDELAQQAAVDEHQSLHPQRQLSHRVAEQQQQQPDQQRSQHLLQQGSDDWQQQEAHQQSLLEEQEAGNHSAQEPQEAAEASEHLQEMQSQLQHLQQQPQQRHEEQVEPKLQQEASPGSLQQQHPAMQLVDTQLQHQPSQVHEEVQQHSEPASIHISKEDGSLHASPTGMTEGLQQQEDAAADTRVVGNSSAAEQLASSGYSNASSNDEAAITVENSAIAQEATIADAHQRHTSVDSVTRHYLQKEDSEQQQVQVQSTPGNLPSMYAAAGGPLVLEQESSAHARPAAAHASGTCSGGSTATTVSVEGSNAAHVSAQASSRLASCEMAVAAHPNTVVDAANEPAEAEGSHGIEHNAEMATAVAGTNGTAAPQAAVSSNDISAAAAAASSANTADYAVASEGNAAEHLIIISSGFADVAATSGTAPAVAPIPAAGGSSTVHGVGTVPAERDKAAPTKTLQASSSMAKATVLPGVGDNLPGAAEKFASSTANGSSGAAVPLNGITAQLASEAPPTAVTPAAGIRSLPGTPSITAGTTTAAAVAMAADIEDTLDNDFIYQDDGPDGSSSCSSPSAAGALGLHPPDEPTAAAEAAVAPAAAVAAYAAPTPHMLVIGPATTQHSGPVISGSAPSAAAASDWWQQSAWATPWSDSGSSSPSHFAAPAAGGAATAAANLPPPRASSTSPQRLYNRPVHSRNRPIATPSTLLGAVGRLQARQIGTLSAVVRPASAPYKPRCDVAASPQRIAVSCSASMGWGPQQQQQLWPPLHPQQQQHNGPRVGSSICVAAAGRPAWQEPVAARVSSTADHYVCRNLCHSGVSGSLEQSAVSDDASRPSRWLGSTSLKSTGVYSPEDAQQAILVRPCSADAALRPHIRHPDARRPSPSRMSVSLLAASAAGAPVQFSQEAWASHQQQQQNGQQQDWDSSPIPLNTPRSKPLAAVCAPRPRSGSSGGGSSNVTLPARPKTAGAIEGRAPKHQLSMYRLLSPVRSPAGCAASANCVKPAGQQAATDSGGNSNSKNNPANAYLSDMLQRIRHANNCCSMLQINRQYKLAKATRQRWQQEQIRLEVWEYREGSYAEQQQQQHAEHGWVCRGTLSLVQFNQQLTRLIARATAAASEEPAGYAGIDARQRAAYAAVSSDRQYYTPFPGSNSSNPEHNRSSNSSPNRLKPATAAAGQLACSSDKLH